MLNWSFSSDAHYSYITNISGYLSLKFMLCINTYYDKVVNKPILMYILKIFILTNQILESYIFLPKLIFQPLFVPSFVKLWSINILFIVDRFFNSILIQFI